MAESIWIGEEYQSNRDKFGVKHYGYVTVCWFSTAKEATEWNLDQPDKRLIRLVPQYQSVSSFGETGVTGPKNQGTM